MCSEEKFSIWKVKIGAFVDAIDKDHFNAILKSPFIPWKSVSAQTESDKISTKPREKYSAEDIKQISNHKRAMNILFITLDDNLFKNITNCIPQQKYRMLSSPCILIQLYKMFAYINGKDVIAVSEWYF